MERECIKINGRTLQLGVLSNEEGYMLYLHPGMTVEETAFCHMVTIRLLLKDGHIKSKREFDKLINKYFTDPKYAPLEDTKEDEQN